MKKYITDLRAAIAKTVTSLNSIVEQFPEGMRKQLDESRNAVVQALEGIKIDDADDAALPTALEVMSRSHAAVLSSLEDLSKQHATAQQSLNRLAELDQRISAGTLVEKAKVDELVTNARAEGETQALARVQLLASRRALVAQDSLPLPNDSVLVGTDEEFNARLELVRKRSKEMTGVSLNGVFGASLWAEEASYQRDLALVKESRSQAPGPNPLAAPGNTVKLCAAI